MTMYELGDVGRDEYLRRREELDREAASLRVAAEPAFLAQRTALSTLVDDWDAMGPDQRKRVLASVFEEIVVGENGVEELLPREGWPPYLKAALDRPRVLAERKTGLYVRNVETTGLIKDERGWLQLVG